MTICSGQVRKWFPPRFFQFPHCITPAEGFTPGQDLSSPHVLFFSSMSFLRLFYAGLLAAVFLLKSLVLGLLQSDSTLHLFVQGKWREVPVAVKVLHLQTRTTMEQLHPGGNEA